MIADHEPLTPINIFVLLFFLWISNAEFVVKKGSLPYEKSAMAHQQHFVTYTCILTEIISADEQARQDWIISVGQK